MPFVDTNRLKGNYAQNVVAEWLSRVCFVRPVSEGTDIGIDLYCESIVENTPFLHFWVQVKAIPESDVRDESAYFDFETRHLRYWQRQPIPVYAFLVPLDSWPPAVPKRVFGVRVTEYLIEHGMPDQDTLRLWSSGTFETATIDRDLTDFVSKIVPWDTSIILIRKGAVVPIPAPDDNQEKSLPADIAQKYLDKILENIADAATLGLIELVKMEAGGPGNKPLRQRFATLVSLFRDDLDKLGLSALVVAKVFDEGKESAKVFAEELIVAVMNNPRIDQATKVKRVTALRELTS